MYPPLPPSGGCVGGSPGAETPREPTPRGMRRDNYCARVGEVNSTTTGLPMRSETVAEMSSDLAE